MAAYPVGPSGVEILDPVAGLILEYDRLDAPPKVKQIVVPAGLQKVSKASGVWFGASSREDGAIVIAMLFRPRFLPPVGAVATAADGTIWLRREPTTKADSIDYLVLDRSGVPQGVAAFPVTDAVIDADGPSVWATGRSEDGTPLLKRYRLNRR